MAGLLLCPQPTCPLPGIIDFANSAFSEPENGDVEAITYNKYGRRWEQMQKVAGSTSGQEDVGMEHDWVRKVMES